MICPWFDITAEEEEEDLYISSSVKIYNLVGKFYLFFRHHHHCSQHLLLEKMDVIVGSADIKFH